jgi:DNA-directed RNA polymerase specialized sigma24 family protein
MANGELSRRIASLMASFRQGNRSAVGELIEILHPELRRLAAAKMKGERTVDEIAEQLGCAPITVTRYWNVARHWLREEFAGARQS